MWFERDEGPDDAFWEWSQQVISDSPDQKSMAEAAMTVYLGREFSFGQNRAITLAEILGLGNIAALEPIGYNVVASVTDTMAGHLLRNKVRPLFVTERGSVQDRMNAAGMQRGIEGEFHNAGIYTYRGTDVCYRGLILNAGGVKVCVDRENKRLDHQTVWPHEFYVPKLEAYRDCVHQMVHEYDVDRAVLKRMFPEHAEEIDKAPWHVDQSTTDSREVSDRVTVREGWHLPTLDPALHDEHDGVRVLSIPGKELLREPYAHDRFPVAWFRPMRMQGEYWSRGYPERLAGAQMKLNEYQERIDEILNLHARPLIVAWQRAGIRRDKITNAVGTILSSKVPPHQALWQMTPQAVPRELVERVQAIIAWAEKQAGVSELSISAQKPVGIEHAPALQHLADTESVRHTDVFRSWEIFHTDLARVDVNGLRELAELDPGYETVFHNNREMKRVKWKDVDLGRNRYVLTCHPSNLLPTTPTAKINLLGQMIDYQMLSPGEAMSRFENPDISDLLGDTSAMLENVERIIQDAIDQKGADAMPHAYLDLASLQARCKERINRMQADGEEPEVTQRVINLFESARQLELKMAAETANANAPGGQATAPGVAGMAGAPAAAPAPVAPAGPPEGAPGVM